MWLLILVSLLWGFSFGLIKNRLAALDPSLVSVLRLLLALLVFLPFVRLRPVPLASRLRLALVGALQFGLMYLFYNNAFQYLKAWEVALFTLLTPLYIVLLDAALERRWSWRYFWAALLALAGALVVREPQSLGGQSLQGLLLVQGANLCFALGQLLWRRERKRLPADLRDFRLFAYPYAGAFLCCAAWAACTVDWPAVHIGAVEGLSLAYLGVVASGLCFFWWNMGAERVNAGVLAVMNNMKTPIAIALSIVVFSETADLPRLLAGGGVLAIGVWIASD